ncbi:MAG: hypothetical protein ACE5IR_03280 [bacterium]
MKDKEFRQSDYMSSQLMEIESFRISLTQQGQEAVTFQDAALLWVAQGYADEFRSQYMLKKYEFEPAYA